MPVLVDLRQVRAEALEPVLDEEVAMWNSEMDWDHRPSADLVLRFVRMGTLAGYALIDGSRASGYCYYVQEDDKGLIGGLYVTREATGNGDSETRLLASSLRALAATPLVRRVESQFMMLSPPARARIPYPSLVETWDRLFLTAPARTLAALPAGKGAELVDYPSRAGREWSERDRESAARLISRAYAGHVDARINDNYKTVAGARRFLANLAEYPGCGSFFSPGSMLAVDRVSGESVGVCLASLVAFDVGHITQVCLDPRWMRRGLGYEMVRRSAAAMAAQGCRAVSLTVTETNVDAVRLYERMGFRLRKRFEAFVWDGVGR